MAWVATAIAGSAVLGAMSSSDAASTQADAANKASDMQMQQFNQLQQNLSPYMALGTAAINPMLEAMGYTPVYSSAPTSTIASTPTSYQPSATAAPNSQGNVLDLMRAIANSRQSGQAAPIAGSPQASPSASAPQLTGLTRNPNSPLNQTFDYGKFNYQPFSFDASQLEKTPGYQFALQQGLRGVNASAAAKGLGVSGANIKGAADYVTGLADQTYGNQFNRALQQYQTNYDSALGQYQQNYNTALGKYQTNYNSAANNAARIAGLVQTGQNSAANVGTQGMAAAQNSGNFLTSGANAQAAGMIGGANAISNGVGTYLNYNNQNSLINAINANNANNFNNAASPFMNQQTGMMNNTWTPGMTSGFGT